MRGNEAVWLILDLPWVCDRRDGFTDQIASLQVALLGQGVLAVLAVGLLPVASLALIAAHQSVAAVDLHHVSGVAAAVGESWLHAGPDLEVAAVLKFDDPRSGIRLRRCDDLWLWLWRCWSGLHNARTQQDQEKR